MGTTLRPPARQSNDSRLSTHCCTLAEGCMLDVPCPVLYYTNAQSGLSLSLIHNIVHQQQWSQRLCVRSRTNEHIKQYWDTYSCWPASLFACCLLTCARPHAHLSFRHSDVGLFDLAASITLLPSNHSRNTGYYISLLCTSFPESLVVYLVVVAL